MQLCSHYIVKTDGTYECLAKPIAPNQKASTVLCPRCSRVIPYTEYNTLIAWIGKRNQVLRVEDSPLKEVMADIADSEKIGLPLPKIYAPKETNPINPDINPFFDIEDTDIDEEGNRYR